VAKVTEGRWAKLGVVVAIVTLGFGIYFGFSSSKSGTGTAPSTSPGKTVLSSSATPVSRKTPAPTPVWTSPNPMLIGNAGVDFDSIPPVANNGANTLYLYLGSYLSTPGSIRITKWTNNVPPTRDQCNVSAQTQGDYQQPAEVGQRYCLLTGQGHTVYLKITSIDNSNTGDVKAYADVIVWNTAG